MLHADVSSQTVTAAVGTQSGWNSFNHQRGTLDGVSPMSHIKV